MLCPWAVAKVFAGATLMKRRLMAKRTAAFAWLIVHLLSATAAAAEPGRPLEVLYITGGCCHDYEGQKAVITAGLSARARIRTTVVHEGGAATTHRVSIYSKPAGRRATTSSSTTSVSPT